MPKAKPIPPPPPVAELKLADVARIAGVTLRTVSRWIARGLLPVRREGRRAFVPWPCQLPQRRQGGGSTPKVTNAER